MSKYTNKQLTQTNFVLKVIGSCSMKHRKIIKDLGGGIYSKDLEGWVFKNSLREKVDGWIENIDLVDELLEHWGSNPDELFKSNPDISVKKIGLQQVPNVTKELNWSTIGYIEKYDMVRKLWGELIKIHNITDWKLCLNVRLLSTAGKCIHNKKQIDISTGYIKEASEKDIKNTLLHEIAHALAGYKAGHGDVWKKIAISIGCDGKRCHDVIFGLDRAKGFFDCKIGCKGNHSPIFNINKQKIECIEGKRIYKCRVCKNVVKLTLC
jgi:predicted SprT family Zn-dependent metalloprotease